MRFSLVSVFAVVFVACGGQPPVGTDAGALAGIEEVSTSISEVKTSGDSIDVKVRKPLTDSKKVCAGDQVLISSTVKAKDAFTGLVFITVSDPNGEVVFERFFIEEFDEGEKVTFQAAFLVPDPTVEGVYSVVTRVEDSSGNVISESKEGFFVANNC
jgi:hypothetical protein